MRVLKSSSTGVYKNKTLSEIFNSICNKFSISSSVVDSKYIIPYIFFENDSFFEILSDAILKTKVMTGVEYVISLENNVASLKILEQNAEVYDLSESNVIYYNYSFSYDNLINYVEVYQMSVNSLYSTYSVQDDELVSKFGVLSKSYKVNKSYSSSECLQLAKQYLDDAKKITETLSITLIADKIINPFDVIQFKEKLYIVNDAILNASYKSHTYSLICTYLGGA